MEKNHIATYTVELPVRFKFKASADLESDVLWKMAESYANLVLMNAPKVDFDEKKAEVINKEVHYTAEERAEMDRNWNKIFEDFEKSKKRG